MPAKRKHKIFLCPDCEALLRAHNLRISLPTQMPKWNPTADQAEFIRQSWGTLTAQEIADQCSTAKNNIYYYAKRMGFPQVAKNFKRLHKTWADAYKSNPNLTFSDLAATWNVSLSTIRNAMATQGIYGRGTKTKVK